MRPDLARGLAETGRVAEAREQAERCGGIAGGDALYRRYKVGRLWLDRVAADLSALRRR